MAKKKTKKPLKTRDHLMVKVINGVTKAGVHKDKKKEANRSESRQYLNPEELCRQCHHPVSEGVPTHYLSHFCSDQCENLYDSQLGDEYEDSKE